MSSREFAEYAAVSWATVKRFELCEGVPRSRGGTLKRVKLAFEEAGIEFLGDPVRSPGVRLRARSPSD
jgi:hypothetical protein